MKKKLHVHFMGIGGSAISGVALMSRKQGYIVSGCNLDKDTDYLGKVTKSVKKVYIGHDESHLKDVDLLVVSPSVLFVNRNHPEVSEARKRRILMTWEEFLGRYLHKNKQVICVAGTHGKSTTTALVGQLFGQAGLDPSVVIGAKVGKWGGNYIYGNGKIFITEADEFFDNFLNYSPETIILNNIEFDHPDFFESEDSMIESYKKFVKLLQNPKNLIVNQDSEGIKKLFEKLDKDFLKSINIYGYTFSDKALLKTQKSAKIDIIKKTKDQTEFRVKSESLGLNTIYYLSIPGEYNVANAAGVIILAKLYGIKDKIAKRVLADFEGVGRRLELIGEKRGIKVYDDYAHHPTAIKATLGALRQKHAKNRIWLVVEPHSYSRTKALLKDYKGVFKNADRVIVGPIYKARDKKTFGISEKDLIRASGHKDITAFYNFEAVAENLLNGVKQNDVILVMGAGYSYKWARQIFKNL